MDESMSSLEDTSTNPKNNFPLVLVIIVALLFGAGWYLANRPPSPAPDSTMSPVSQDSMTSETGSGESLDESVDSAMMEGDVQVFTLEAGSFYFEPNVIQVKKGDKVKVVINAVDMMHDFVIDELGVATPIVKSGNTGEVEFTADTIGEFEFYCSVGAHRAEGMVGQLIVTE